eukprot:GDKJ01015355.1.p1 GENE.GDKJ01015355.1~~GDKJ01015355.1.p1  ORF type:complete len:372 (+),score=64.00 GDKJ01015355.1:124-1116(+)
MKNEVKTRLVNLKQKLSQINPHSDPQALPSLINEISRTMTELNDLSSTDIKLPPPISSEQTVHSNIKSFKTSPTRHQSPTNVQSTSAQRWRASRNAIPSSLLDLHLSPERREQFVSPSRMSPSADLPSTHFFPNKDVSRLGQRTLPQYHNAITGQAEAFRSPLQPQRVRTQSSPLYLSRNDGGDDHTAMYNNASGAATVIALEEKVQKIISQAPRSDLIQIPHARVTSDIFVFDQPLKLTSDDTYGGVVIVGPAPYRGKSLLTYLCDLVERTMDEDTYKAISTVETIPNNKKFSAGGWNQGIKNESNSISKLSALVNNPPSFERRERRLK